MRLPERQACRIMVDLLALAHERGCESELADLLASRAGSRAIAGHGRLAGPLRARSRRSAARRRSSSRRSMSTKPARRQPDRETRHEDEQHHRYRPARHPAQRTALPAIKLLWSQFAEQADKEGWPAARFLAAIAEHELAERDRRRIERHLAEARLLPGKTLDTFDFEAVPMISKAQVMALAAGDAWLEKGANLLLFGPPGGGKSHLASAIGLALVENGWRVLFTRTTDLVQKLQVARRELGLEAAIDRLDRFHLLILDDLAYVTKDQAETSVLFELISARYERRSMLITANQPFGEWGKVFPDPAMTLAAIDRLVHHATIFEMNVESYRRREAIERKRGPGRPASYATPANIAADWLGQSKPDPFDLVLREAFLCAVVEFGGARALVGCHFLGVLKRTAIGEIGGDPGRSEGVTADFRRDAGRLGAAAYHAPGVRLTHLLVG